MSPKIKPNNKPARGSGDLYWMSKALEAARKGIGKTTPNPPVGAVVVKGGRMIADGYHAKAGGPHAEVVALKKAGKAARGAVIYVTLEPCSTHGKTPPCTEALIAAGIRRVVYAAKDPGRSNGGRAARVLKRRGISVRSGVLEKESQVLIRPFATVCRKRRPWVSVKMAQSLDGKIATVNGASKWISSPASRDRVQQLRAGADAIMVGIGTVLKDDPRLDVRKQGANTSIKVIVDSKLRIKENARLFKTSGPVMIASTHAAPAAKRAKLARKAGLVLTRSRKGRVDLKQLMRVLAACGVLHVMVEGGGELVAALIEEQLVDEVLLFVAPKIIGGKQAPTAVEGRGVRSPAQALALKQTTVERIGEDILIRGLI